jgi:hypothetical protein
VTVTVTFDVVARLPASETFTQQLPAFSVADSCGLPATVAPDVDVVIVQFPSLDCPTPSPSGPVVAGDTAVSVTATLPAVATENVKTSEPFGARGPLKVSVVEVLLEGVVGLSKSLLNGLEQADVIITDVGIRSDRKSRATFMLALIGPGARLISVTDQPERSSKNLSLHGPRS